MDFRANEQRLKDNTKRQDRIFPPQSPPSILDSYASEQIDQEYFQKSGPLLIQPYAVNKPKNSANLGDQIDKIAHALETPDFSPQKNSVFEEKGPSTTRNCFKKTQRALTKDNSKSSKKLSKKPSSMTRVFLPEKVPPA